VSDTLDDRLADYYRTAVPAQFPACPAAMPTAVTPGRRGLSTAAWLALAAGLLLAVMLAYAPKASVNAEKAYDPFGAATAHGKALKATGK
jgi:hypothetical protein